MRTRLSHGRRVLVVSLLACLGVNTWSQQDPTPSNSRPVISITTIDATAAEQSEFIDSIPDTGEFRLFRTGTLDEPLTVFYLVGGTASNGRDYALLDGEVLFPAGQPTALLHVDPKDDDEVETTETVIVIVIPKESAPDGEIGPGDYEVGQPDTASAEIRDDEPRPNRPPTVTISSPPAGAILPLDREIQILAEARDSDGWVASVEFFADGRSIGVAESIQWLPGSIGPTDALNDPNWRPPYLFRIRWTNPEPGAHKLSAVALDNLGAESESEPVEITLLELPEPTVVHVIAADPEAAEGPIDPTLEAIPDPASFTLVRSGPLDFPLVVYFELGGTAVNGVDYRDMPTSAIIPEGKRTIDVIFEPIDDLLPERTENILLTIVPPVCIEIYPPPPECYLVGTPSIASASIRDNDQVGNTAPRVRMLYPHDGQIMRAPADLQLSAAAWDAGGAVVSVEFFAGDRSLGVVRTPTPVPMPADEEVPEDPSWAVPRYSLTWEQVPPGNYSLTALVTDNDGARSRSAPVQLWVMEPGDLTFVMVESTDPDAAEPGDLTRNERDSGTFTIHRTGSLDHALSVYFRLGGTAQNGIDYEEQPLRGIIAPGEVSVNVEIRPLHDRVAEVTEHVELRLLPVCCVAKEDGSRTCSYVVGEPASARVAIHDSDSRNNAPPRIKLSQPVDGQVFVEPKEIELIAVAQDPDGWVPAVEFFDGGVLIGRSEIVYIREPDPGLPQTFSIVWSEVPPGRHELKARAVDDDGLSTTSGPVLISVVQPGVLSVVTIEAPDPRASEVGPLTADPAEFNVHRRGDLSEPLTVYYDIGGTAETGVDYQRLPGMVEIPADIASATIEVIPVADNLPEEVETVIITLQAPGCPAIFPPPPGCYMVGEPGWAIAGIVDGSAPGNLAPKAEIIRPFPGAAYHAPANITVVTQARDRDGYVTHLEWFANDRKIGEQTMEFITPPPPGELQVFEFAWQAVPAGDYDLTARATDDQGTVSPFSEPVSVTVLPVSAVPVVTLYVADPLAAEMPKADGTLDTASFKVRRSGPMDLPLVVFYQLHGTAESGVDYVALGGQATLPAGSRWAHITVTPVQDDRLEGSETVVVELVPSPALSPIEPYRVGSPHRAAVLVLDQGDPSEPAQRIREWIHLRLDAEPGTAYRLEVSGDLMRWQAVTDEWAEDSGIHHLDIGPDTVSQRFYRILPLAPGIMESPESPGRDW